jgi:isoquinoline 1-oxidoreductase alpha subunit
MEIKVNQQKYPLDVPPDTPLLWALREECGLTGTKFGCGRGLCGACTIHINGAPSRSCITPVSAAAGSEITTIEGAKGLESLKVVQEAWIELDVVQCGYCQPGQVMAAAALVTSNPNPDEAAIDSAMSAQLCRCGTYPRIRAAVRLASQKWNELKKKGVR